MEGPGFDLGLSLLTAIILRPQPWMRKLSSVCHGLGPKATC